MTQKKVVLLLVGVMGFMGFSAQAEEKASPPSVKSTVKNSDPKHGRDLMSPEEHKEYNAKMRAAKTDEECDALRAEHHKKMQEKAKEKGIALPKEPMRKGCTGRRGMGGMGPGMGGMGPGMRGQ